MMKWGAYARLLRLHKPAGILLLWFPTAWALWVANKGTPALRLVVIFALGTLVMRAAGCVFNDIVDRHIDKKVRRTAARPLASGEVGLMEAYFILLLLGAIALMLALYLPWQCLYLAITALAITLLYPFCKRFISAPQMVLGLAFSMGIPMAYTASKVPYDASFLLIFLMNFIWIIAYDTMYALTDKEDDLKIGVKSTAIYFADYDRLIIGILLCVLHSLWLFWALLTQVHTGFYACWAAAIFVLLYQQRIINLKIPELGFKAFTVSVYYGLFMWLGVLLAF